MKKILLCLLTFTALAAQAREDFECTSQEITLSGASSYDLKWNLQDDSYTVYHNVGQALTTIAPQRDARGEVTHWLTGRVYFGSATSDRPILLNGQDYACEPVR